MATIGVKGRTRRCMGKSHFLSDKMIWNKVYEVTVCDLNHYCFENASLNLRQENREKSSRFQEKIEEQNL